MWMNVETWSIALTFNPGALRRPETEQCTNLELDFFLITAWMKVILILKDTL
jgi:hypothetical protein